MPTAVAVAVVVVVVANIVVVVVVIVVVVVVVTVVIILIRTYILHRLYISLSFFACVISTYKNNYLIDSTLSLPCYVIMKNRITLASSLAAFTECRGWFRYTLSTHTA